MSNIVDFLSNYYLFKSIVYLPNFILWWNSSAIQVIAECRLFLRFKYVTGHVLKYSCLFLFDGWRNFNAETAKKHARAELALYKKRKKIEAMGIEYDEEALAAGEYDEVLMN
jgi:hypothetical protein